jgi:hypothetical protein
MVSTKARSIASVVLKRTVVLTPSECGAVDGRGRRALAGMHAFRLEHDVKFAVLVLDDVALAYAACDDFDHFVSFHELPE